MNEDLKKTGGDLLSRVSSTIGARGLNFCVRNGNRYFLIAMGTEEGDFVHLVPYTFHGGPNPFLRCP